MPLKVSLTPRKSMIRSAMWVAISAIWLLLVSLKLQMLRSAGGYVSPFRYAMVIFWAATVAFWIVNFWRDWKRLRTEAVGKVS